MELAGEMITANGLNGLTMAGLAKRAGIALPVLYTHFPNRRAIAIELIEEHAREITRFFEAGLSPDMSLKDYLRRVAEAAFAFETISKIPIRALRYGFLSGDDIARTFRQYENIFERHWECLLVQVGAEPTRATIVAPVLAGVVNIAVERFGGTALADGARAALGDMLLGVVGQETGATGHTRVRTAEIPWKVVEDESGAEGPRDPFIG